MKQISIKKTSKDEHFVETSYLPSAVAFPLLITGLGALMSTFALFVVDAA